MPIYEYRCVNCGGRFEILLPSAARAKARCTRCGAARVERLLSHFAVGKAGAAENIPGPCGSPRCACRVHDA
jgi:putative FmdB family regulatory protein